MSSGRSGTHRPGWVWVALLALVAAAPAHPLSGQVRATGSAIGRVLDAETLEPMAGVVITIAESPLQAVSDIFGGFRIDEIPEGERYFLIEHRGYAVYGQRFVMEAGASLTFPLYLAPLEGPEAAAARAPADGDGLSGEAPRGGAGAERGGSRVILRPAILDAAGGGLGLADLLRRDMPSLRFRVDGGVGGGECVEFRGGAMGSQCRQLGVAIDGIRANNPGTIYHTVSLYDLERIQLLAPSEAGIRFGSEGGYGVLLLTTTRGAGARSTPEENLEFLPFDWAKEEAEPYRWKRVLLSSFLTNAAAVGATLAANDCLRTSERVEYLAVRTVCGNWGTISTVALTTALPGIATGVVTNWAGSTRVSRGRLVPSALFGTAATIGGWVLVLSGEVHDNPATTAAGVGVLTVASPLIVTFADRLFRVRR